jgi:hypothetical protein
MPVSTADREHLHPTLVEVLGQRDADALMELLRPPEGWPDDRARVGPTVHDWPG